MPSMATTALVLSTLLAAALAKPKLEEFGPWMDIKTEPEFRAAMIEVHTFPDKGTPSTDALFTTLRSFAGYGPWGPQIFDSSGDLVFYGNPSAPVAIQDPRPCPFQGEDPPAHLCATDPTRYRVGHVDVIPRVYDNTYRAVDPMYHNVGNLGSADGHEFYVLDKDTALSTNYVDKEWDVSAVEGGDKYGKTWTYDACFQDIRTHTRDVVFQWCALDHIGITETVRTFHDVHLQNFPPSLEDPFDFAHINSVDKDADGDYLVSFKYLNQIMKIAGNSNKQGLEPKTIIWRLGGRQNDFEFASPDVDFSFQHYARFFPVNVTDDDVTRISLFDNHCESHTFDGCSIASAAKIVEIRNSTRTASLVRSYPHPHGNMSWAGGSVDVMRNGNIFVSWGQVNDVSEFNQATGELVMHAQLGASPKAFQYRSARGPWHAQPTWRPKMLAYLPGCDTEDKTRKQARTSAPRARDAPTPDLHIHVSWNGATDVASWTLEASSTGLGDSSWVKVKTVAKTGFETHATVSCQEVAHVAPNVNATLTPGCFPGHFRTTALDEHGNVKPRGQTEKSNVWVPDAELAKLGCGAASCTPYFPYKPEQNSVAKCFPTDRERFYSDWVAATATWDEATKATKPKAHTAAFGAFALAAAVGAAVWFTWRARLRSKSPRLPDDDAAAIQMLALDKLKRPVASWREVLPWARWSRRGPGGAGGELSAAELGERLLDEAPAKGFASYTDDDPAPGPAPAAGSRASSSDTYLGSEYTDSEAKSSFVEARLSAGPVPAPVSGSAAPSAGSAGSAGSSVAPQSPRQPPA